MKRIFPFTMAALLLCSLTPAGAFDVVETKLTASDGASHDWFGYPVTIDGDIIVIGAYQDDDNGTDSGSAYVFRRQGTAWVEEQKLTASDGAPYDWFGIQVGVEGDTIVVGARRDDDKGVDSGSAYVFRRVGATWVEEQKLTASDGSSGDLFGVALCIEGDTILIGASLDGAGSAYIFQWNGSLWVEEQKLTASDGVAGDRFGWGVSLDGDTLVVGAMYDDDTGYQSGSAYVFRRNGSLWAEEQKLTASDGGPDDWFGLAVSVDGDTVVVPSPYHHHNAPDMGAAFVFRWNGLAWVEEQELFAIAGQAGVGWGEHSVSMDGDILVIGNIRDNDKGTQSGSLHVFRWNETAWVEEQKLTASDGDAYDHLGYLGTPNAVDGRTVVVGAYGDDDRGTDSGAAYVFELTPEDQDNDGVPDVDDNCVFHSNPDQIDTDLDSIGDLCDDCTDTDGDGLGNPAFPDNTCAPDNCPDIANPIQFDVDSDGAGDLCDICPADPMNACDPSGSTAEEVAADQGGTVQTPDDLLTIDIGSEDLAEDTTISVTETIPQDPEVDLMVGTNPGLGQAIAVYDLQPNGMAFASPVTLTILVDVSDLNTNQRNRLTLYRFTDTDGDGVDDTFVEIAGTILTIIEDPPGKFTATVTAEVDHFSVFGVVAPLDTDGDGIFDLFWGIEDICPNDANVIEGFLPPMTDLVLEGNPVLLPDRAFKSSRTLPMKFNYSCGTVPVTDQDPVTPPALLEMYRVGEAEPLPIIDPDSGESNDSGIWFRYSDEHWIYNFSTIGFPGGTYEVRVRMPDGRVFQGGFVLR